VSQEAIKQQMELILEGMRAGKIDVEAGNNALETLSDYSRHEDMVKNRSMVPSNHAVDAFGYGGIAGQAESRAVRRKPTVWDKLCMRMDWELIGAAKKRKVELFEDSGYVIIMGVRNGEPFVIKDDENLFPSDQVVTQLRLLYDGE
jgi:hypothetical protein